MDKTNGTEIVAAILSVGFMLRNATDDRGVKLESFVKVYEETLDALKNPQPEEIQ